MACRAFEMKILAAILAGGQSRRFGSDKALATVDGKTMLDHVADALTPQVDAIVVVGRSSPGMNCVADVPRTGLGPLGGLAGALVYARDHGFDAVLSSGCDLIGLPDDLVLRLTPGPAIVGDLPLVGLWPILVVESLVKFININDKKSVYGFAEYIDARRITLPKPILNANHPDDLRGTDGARPIV